MSIVSGVDTAAVLIQCYHWFNTQTSSEYLALNIFLLNGHLAKNNLIENGVVLPDISFKRTLVCFPKDVVMIACTYVFSQ